MLFKHLQPQGWYEDISFCTGWHWWQRYTRFMRAGPGAVIVPPSQPRLLLFLWALAPIIVNAAQSSVASCSWPILGCSWPTMGVRNLEVE